MDEFEVDLHGLVVLTEAASGAYALNAPAAARAGADRVLAVTKDSRFGAKEDVRSATLALADDLGVRDRLAVGFNKPPEWLATADVVTNSGFVRPITAADVAQLKPTATIPLMWETWEFRRDDLDLGACREHGVVVLGTDESKPPCDMAPWTGLMGIRMLFDLGLEVHKSRVLLLGRQPTLAGAIKAALEREGAAVFTYGEVDAAAIDALICAEHHDPALLLGLGGVFDPLELTRANPGLRVGVVAGNVDGERLRQSGLVHAPERIEPFGWMSYQPSVLGPRPILELFVAGLKVAQVTARARLSGATPREAATLALDRSPAMDFEGELAWS